GAGTENPGLRATIEIPASQGKYSPNQDEPRYLDDRGPRCYPIVIPGPGQPPAGPFVDGTEPHANPPPTTQFGDAEDFGAVPTSYSGADMGVPNSPGERQVVSELLALQQGTSPDAVPAWSTMLVGPLYRGTEVKLT